MRGSYKVWLFPAIFGIVGVAILYNLGAWQMRRLEWKEAIISKAQEQLVATPVEIPEEVEPDKHGLLRVEAIGYLEKVELHVLTSMKVHGPGFRVIVPMELAQDNVRTGRKILVDLGFVPTRMKSLIRREPTSVRMQKRHPRDRVIGLLHWPDETDGYTPDPDEERRIWFARDVAAMAKRLGTEPVLLVAQKHPDGNVPLPQPPGVNIPNRHLEYALAWYGLAIVWAIMTLVWLRSRFRENQTPPGAAPS